jgi:hypothetical protein
LTKPIGTPPYTDDQLNAGGNAYECPLVAGRDVRLSCSRVLGNNWLLGNLLLQAVEFLANGKMIGKCFDADGGRYHFLGYTHNKENAHDLISVVAGIEFLYERTTFVFYQWRPK